MRSWRTIIQFGLAIICPLPTFANGMTEFRCRSVDDVKMSVEGDGSHGCFGWIQVDCTPVPVDVASLPRDGADKRDYCLTYLRPDSDSFDKAAKSEESSTVTPASASPGNTTKGVGNSVNKGAHSANTKKIESHVESAGDSQSSSLEASQQVVSLGANQSATVGALYCAEGAINIEIDPQLSGQSVRNCQDQFHAANDMMDLERKRGGEGTLRPDPAVMEQDGAKNILGNFEKKFGVPGDLYMDRMLATGGSRNELAGMLRSAASEAQIGNMFAAAEAAESESKEQNTYALNAGGGPKRKAPEASLRSQLVKEIKLANEGKRSPSSVAGNKSTAQKFDDLSPVSADAILGFANGAPSDIKELSLFDVVHKKYMDLAAGRLKR